MEAHVLIFYKLFSPTVDPLDARSCLCLCDALMRAVLRGSGRGITARPEVTVPTVPTAKDPPAAALKCGFCGEEFEEIDMFCTSCGARRPNTDVVSPPRPWAPATPVQSSQGRLGSPSRAQMPLICQAPLVTPQVAAQVVPQVAPLVTPQATPQVAAQFAPQVASSLVTPLAAAPFQAPQAPRQSSPKRLDSSRIRTCRPVSAEMGPSLQAPVRTPLMTPAVPSMPTPAMQVPYVRSQ